MDKEEIEVLATTAWLFTRHGRADRALPLLEAILEEKPDDGIAAAMLADIRLSRGEADAALDSIRKARFPKELARAAALLETRALKNLGRETEAHNRWSRDVEAAKGANRKWVQ